jgi:hypothetical protein
MGMGMACLVGDTELSGRKQKLLVAVPALL